MVKTKTIQNLRNIFIQSYRWRNSDLSSNHTDIKFSLLSKLNIILFILGLFIVLTGHNVDDFSLNGILTFASIFATLIIPVLILVYDKFSNNPNSHLTGVQQKSAGAKERIVLYKNFTSRFIFTALENVFIAVSIISIILIYKGFLSNFFAIDPFNYSFQKSFDLNGIYLAIKVGFIIISKTIFILLLLKFILFIFYSVGALGDFFHDGLKNSL